MSLTAPRGIRKLNHLLEWGNISLHQTPVGSLLCRERMLRLLSAKGSLANSDVVTTINDGQEVAAPDIVGIWNNQYPGVLATLKNNVVGLISQVGGGEDH